MILFHDISLKDCPKIIDYIRSKANEHTQIRFAIGFFNTSSTFFDDLKFFDKLELTMSNFENIGFFSSKKIQFKLDARSEILNLKWKASSCKLVLNLGKNLNSMQNFATSLDAVTGLIKIKEINFINHEFGFSWIDHKLIDFIFGSYLMQTVRATTQVYYFKELYFLKRHQFKSYEEYKSERSLIRFNNDYTKFQSKSYGSSNYIIYFDTYDKVDTQDPLSGVKEIDSDRKKDLTFDGLIREPSKCLFITSAKYYKPEYNRWGQKTTLKSGLWLEKVDNLEAFKRMIDIHLTAKYIIESFNAECKKHDYLFEIEQAFVKLGKVCRELFYASFVNLDLARSELELPSSSTQDILDSLAHYSYQCTSGDLVLFDIRPVKLSEYRLSITEPIIFSNAPNRFSSSDLGAKGIASFKLEHRCNSICKKLSLSRLI